jgi:MazG family protein
MSSDSIAKEFVRLVDIIRQLRDPLIGCPWDKEQTHQSLKPYLIEESYEVLDAIDSSDTAELCQELGDVLLQVVLHSQVAKDSGQKAFDIEDVISGLSDKLVRRHPHIFSDVIVENSTEVKKNWEAIKKSERAETSEFKSALDGVPNHLPGLLKAARLGEKAARLGFDWQSSTGVKEKVLEELAEVEAEKSESKEQAEEFGDLLFTLAQWARHNKIDAEEAVRQACNKFKKRFQVMERQVEDISSLSQVEKESLWTSAKNLDKI